VTGGWRKLHNEKFHNVYALPDISRIIRSSRMRWVVHVASIGVMIDAYKILVGKPEGKRLLGRPRSRREDNIKMYLRDIVMEVVG
jgi:hypothetical protein